MIWRALDVKRFVTVLKTVKTIDATKFVARDAILRSSLTFLSINVLYIVKNLYPVINMFVLIIAIQVSVNLVM